MVTIQVEYHGDTSRQGGNAKFEEIHLHAPADFGLGLKTAPKPAYAVHHLRSPRPGVIALRQWYDTERV